MTAPRSRRPPDTPPRDGPSSGVRRLSASGVRVRLGDRDVLGGVDLAVDAGEIVAVSGPSGAGKTTLLLVLAGVLAPDVGDVEIAGGSGWPEELADAAALVVEAALPNEPLRLAQGRATRSIFRREGSESRRSEARRSNLGGHYQLSSGDPSPFAAPETFDPLSSPDIPAPPPTARRDRAEPSRTAAAAGAAGSLGHSRGAEPSRGRRGEPAARSASASASAGGGSAASSARRYAGWGRSREASSAARTRLGFVPQTFGLAPWLTAAENVALLMQVLRMPRYLVKQRTVEVLDAVGLGPASDRIVTELSGGQRQRVAVARALAAEPDVIIADEPTAELDAENRARVLELLLDAAEAGAAVIIATHDPEVTRTCTRLLTLEDGRLVDADA